jgi:DNA (cytosine-5)-methyltransferase 1
MDFIMEEVKIIKEGNYSPSGHNASSIVSTQGIAPAVMENHGTVTAIKEPQVINPLKGQSDNGWHFEQQVYDAEGIARAVKAGEGSGNIPKVIEPISVAMRGRNPDNPSERGKSNGNYKQRLEMNESGVANTITSVQKDSMVAEPRVEQVGNIYPDTDTFKNRTMGRVYSNEGLSPTINCCGGGDREPKIVEDWQTIVGNKQLNPFRGSVEGTSPCITSACGAGGGMTPMLTDADLETTKTKEFIEQVRGHEEMRYRIRKLTPRECFRLMGVDDADIDKIQASGISNSQQYKCAGNIIVVDVLYHIFRKMFCETENENDQLCLF